MVRMEFYMFTVIIGAFTLAIVNTIDKHIMEHKMKDAFTYSIFNAITSAVILLTITFLFFRINLSFNSLFTVFLSAIFGGIGVILFYYGLRKGDLSVASPIASSRILFAIPFGILLFNEFYGIFTFFLMLLVLFGVVTSTLSEKIRIRDLLTKNRQLYIFLAVCLLWTIADALIRSLGTGVDTYSAAVMQRVFILIIFVLLLPILVKIGNFKEIKNWRKALPFTIISSILLFISLLGFFYGFQHSLTLSESLVPLQGIFGVAIAFLLSLINPKFIMEKHSKQIYSVRFIGALFIIIGTSSIILIS